MNGPDKHHVEVMELDDGGHSMCYGCKASGPGVKWRPEGEQPNVEGFTAVADTPQYAAYLERVRSIVLGDNHEKDA
ncbi:hypothetical protein [Pseudomonas mediterranea]|uniref:hypothetical protein n=1 Tax=Pseudomonas mediterranea TaxID=183795 RepID=UPI0006D8922A|nr:hypothetical protein [Pseudomonas mediterranea]